VRPLAAKDDPIWAGPFASLFDAWEIALAKSLADSPRGVRVAAKQSRDAAFAAVYSYCAIYGHTIGSGSEPLLAGFYRVWLHRLGNRRSLPFRVEPAQSASYQKQAADAVSKRRA
jgi:hypothetical protein